VIKCIVVTDGEPTFLVCSLTRTRRKAMETWTEHFFDRLISFAGR